MAEKRTKADKEQRQADKVDDKAERRSEQVVGKKKVRKDSSRRLIRLDFRPRDLGEESSENLFA
jgi:hypothetical protein